MTLVLPPAVDDLEQLAEELSGLLDSIAAGVIDASPLLERSLLDVLDRVEQEIQRRIRAADGASSREASSVESTEVR